MCSLLAEWAVQAVPTFLGCRHGRRTTSRSRKCTSSEMCSSGVMNTHSLKLSMLRNLFALRSCNHNEAGVGKLK